MPTASPRIATFPYEKNGKGGTTLTAQRDILKPPKHWKDVMSDESAMFLVY